jgi:uncharacterized integral membrane protein
MRIPHRSRPESIHQTAAPTDGNAAIPAQTAPVDQTPPTTLTPLPPAASPSLRVPATRTSVMWAGVWAAALGLVAFIVFMLQNTGSVHVYFVGMDGSLPLAVALLIALAAGVVLTLTLGTARIGQLRRLARRNR